MHPLERLVNLVALLLDAGRPLTFDEIRRKLPAYGQDDAEAAKRMFERDKDTLRDIGVPLEMTATDAWEVEQGYVIPRDRYELPPIPFTAEELSALMVAAHTAGPEGEAEQAVRKLLAAATRGVEDVAMTGSAATAAGPDLSGPHLYAVASAIARRRSVRFEYRPVTGEPGERHVDPYALLARGGQWYLIGLDRDRGETRSYRLSRFLSAAKEVDAASSPPEGFDAKEQLRSGPWGLGRPQERARVAFSPDVAWWAVRGVAEARIDRTRKGGWVEVTLPAARSDAFVSWVLQFGDDAKLLSPRTVRDALVARLEALRAVL